MLDLSLRPDLKALGSCQHAFCSDITSEYILLAGGYGAGKTYALCRKAIILAAENALTKTGKRSRAIIALVGPTWAQVESDIVPHMLEILEALGLESDVDYFYHQTKHQIRVPRWNWYFKLASMDRPKSLKGPTFTCILLNEPGICPPETWEVLLSRLRDSDARVVQFAMAGTPEGYNWLWKRMIQKPLANTRVIYTKSSDRPGQRAGYVQSMRESFDARLAAEKIGGRFVNTASGLVYYEFIRERNVIPGLQPVDGVPWRVALDFNVDPFIATLCQVFYGDSCPLGHHDCIHALKEIVLNRADTGFMAASVATAINPQLPANTPLYPDATGHRETTAAVDGSDFEILRQAGFWDLRTASVNPRQRDRTAVANGLLRNALGVSRLFYSDECVEGIADRETVGYHNGKIDGRDPQRTHAADGVDYLAYQEFPIGGTSTGGVVNL